ncbi:MAG: hypothetical protein R2874_00860 [Desulfobacterales bacterium]
MMVPAGYTKVKALGRIETISADGDIRLGEDAVYLKLKAVRTKIKLFPCAGRIKK